MENQQPQVKSPGGMLVMTAIVIGCVGYLFWEILSRYLEGGETAPSLTTVIIGGVIMAAGSVYIAACAIRIFLQAKKHNKEEKKSEAE